MNRIVVSSPGAEYFDPGDLQSHNIAARPDAERAVAQHAALKQMLADSGFSVADVPGLPGHPNSVFTRDTAVCIPGGYIRMRMGLDSRRGEEEWMARLLDGMGIACTGRVKSPGTAEGGDVIVAGTVVFIGLSSRTNPSGARQLATLFRNQGFEARLAAVPQPFLHLGGVMTLVGPRRVLTCGHVLTDEFLSGFECLRIPGKSFISGNVISAGSNGVIADIGNRPAIEALSTRGVKVHPVDLSEFIKGNGGPSCLIMPVDQPW
jgi:dimethylargininase